MNKANYARVKREEKGFEEFHLMYDNIRDALSHGIPLGCDLDETLSCMVQNENGIDTLIDYEAVDRYFDEKYGTKALKNIAVRAAQIYSTRYISKKIAQDYLRDNMPEKEQKRVRSTDIYAWKTTDIDSWLGTIYFYARGRRMVKPLSHYVDRGQNTVNRVKDCLREDLKDLCGNLTRYHDEMPSAAVNRFAFLEASRDKYQRLIKEYPAKHQTYIDRYKG